MLVGPSLCEEWMCNMFYTICTLSVLALTCQWATPSEKTSWGYLLGLEAKKKPRPAQIERESRLHLGGRYWDRTSDPHNVNVVLYR